MLLEIDGARKNLKKSLRRSRKNQVCKSKKVRKSKRSRKSRRTKSRRSRRSRKSRRTKSKRSKRSRKSRRTRSRKSRKSRKSKRSKRSRTKSKRSRKSRRTKSKRSRKSRRTKSKRSRKSRRTKSKRSRKTRRTKSKRSRKTKSKRSRRTRSRKSKRSKKARSVRNKKALETCIEFGSRSKRCRNSLKRVTKVAKKSIRKILRSFQIPTAKSLLQRSKDILRQQMLARQQAVAQKLKQGSVLGSIIVSSKEEPMPVTPVIMNVANIILDNPEVKNAIVDSLKVTSTEAPLLNKVDTAIAIAQSLPRDTLLAITDSPSDADKIIEEALMEVEKELPKPVEITAPSISTEIIGEVFGSKVSEKDISVVAGLIQNVPSIKEAVSETLGLTPQEMPMLDNPSSTRTVVETLAPSVVLAILDAPSDSEKAAIIENALEGSKGKETSEVVEIANIIDNVPKIDETIAQVLDLPHGSHDMVNKTDTIEIIASKLSDADLSNISNAPTLEEKADALIDSINRMAPELIRDIEEKEEKENIGQKILFNTLSEILEIPEDIIKKSESVFKNYLTERDADIVLNYLSANNIDAAQKYLETKLLPLRGYIRKEIKELFPGEIVDTDEEIASELSKQLKNTIIKEYIIQNARENNRDIEYIINSLRRIISIQDTPIIKTVQYLMKNKYSALKALKFAKNLPEDIINKINSVESEEEISQILDDYKKNNGKKIEDIENKNIVIENILVNPSVQQAVIDVANLSGPEETTAEIVIGNLNTIEKIVDSLPTKVVEDLSNATSVAEQIENLNKAVDATPSIADNIKKALKECKCDDLLFDLLKAYPNNVLREISEAQFMYYSKLAADRNINICSGGKSYRECFEEYGFKITKEPTKTTVTLSDDFKNKLTQALKKNKEELVSIADEEDKKIVIKAIDSVKSDDLSKVAVQLLLLEDIKPSSTVEDISKAVENNASTISDSLLVPADIFIADEPAVVKDVAKDIINNDKWQQAILENLPFSTDEEKKAEKTLTNPESVLALISSLPESTVSEISNASSFEDKKDLLANAIIENRSVALEVLKECLCDDVVVDILLAFPEKIISEKFVGDYYQQAYKKFKNCIIKSYDSYVDCLRSKGVTILLEGDEVAKVKPNEQSFYPQGEFKEAFDYFITRPAEETENLLKTVKFPSQLKTEGDKLIYLMREEIALMNTTKGDNVLAYITNYNINIDEYKDYLKKNDPEFKYVLGEYEVPYYIMKYDNDKHHELLPKAERLFEDKKIYNRYLDTYKVTPEFRWILDNPNIEDKDETIKVLFYKKHLQKLRNKFKPILYKKLKEYNLREEKFAEANKYFRKIAEQMVEEKAPQYYFGDEDVTETLDNELLEEKMQDIFKYLKNYYKDLKQQDIKDIVIKGYEKFKDLIPPKSVIPDSNLKQADEYFENQGQYLGGLWKYPGNQIFNDMLVSYSYNPFIIAIKMGIEDSETRTRHLKYAVYALKNNLSLI